MTQTTWATTDDVLSLTGTTVTDAQLAQANGVVEVHSGRLYVDAVERTGTRDIEWMRRAVAYQAAWLTAQPDAFSRLDLTQVTQEGRAIGLKEHALTLAPLTERALGRVSWLRSRSLHVRSPFVDGLGPVSTAIIDYDDDDTGW